MPIEARADRLGTMEEVPARHYPVSGDLRRARYHDDGPCNPTEAGAMGAVSAIVLAAIHHKDFSATGRKMLIAGVIAAASAIVAMLYTENLIFKLAFAITTSRSDCPQAVRIPDSRPDQAGL